MIPDKSERYLVQFILSRYNIILACALFEIVKKRDARFCDACVAGSTVKYSISTHPSWVDPLYTVHFQKTHMENITSWILSGGRLVFCVLYIQTVFMLQAWRNWGRRPRRRSMSNSSTEKKHLNLSGNRVVVRVPPLLCSAGLRTDICKDDVTGFPSTSDICSMHAPFSLYMFKDDIFNRLLLYIFPWSQPPLFHTPPRRLQSFPFLLGLCDLTWELRRQESQLFWMTEIISFSSTPTPTPPHHPFTVLADKRQFILPWHIFALKSSIWTWEGGYRDIYSMYFRLKDNWIFEPAFFNWVETKNVLPYLRIRNNSQRILFKISKLGFC